MVLKRKSSLHLEHIEQEDGSENPSTPIVLTPTGGKHVRRQLSEHNFGKTTKKAYFIKWR